MTFVRGDRAAAPSGRRSWAPVAPLAALAATTVAWAAVAVANPGDEGHIWCPWRAVTGLDCPFCGSTRAAASLARGDLVGALDHNAFFVLVVIPAAGLAWAVLLIRARRGRELPVLSTRVLYLGLGMVGLWWVLRLMVPWLGSGTSLG